MKFICSYKEVKKSDKDLNAKYLADRRNFDTIDHQF